MGIFDREETLIGKEALNKLAASKVAVFGAGGVGAAVIETLARAGVGSLDIIDPDTVADSNINRQFIALHSTIGKNKAEVACARVKDINPDCKVRALPVFFCADVADEFDFASYDYVVDAIDTVSAKIELVLQCEKANTHLISSMGTGKKLDPSKFEVADIYKTSVCPLARVMRSELRKRGIKKLKVVYSKEEPRGNERIPSSISFVPPAAGLLIASVVVKDLAEIH